MPLNLGVKLYASAWNIYREECRITAEIVHEGNFDEKIFSVNLLDTKEIFYTGPQRFQKVDKLIAHERLTMMKIPTNLTAFFPNVTVFYISNCGLKSISRNDLKGLEELRKIALSKMDIEELPADLFKDLINLESIELQSNKIKQIGKGIFDGLKNLRVVDLSGNPSVNSVYAAEDYRQFPNVLRFHKLDDLNNYFDEVFRPNAAKPLKPQKTSNPLEDLSKILKCDDFKDFTIKIAENEFKVHKLMLAARSPKLAEMIKQNPGADELILEDIEVEVFKIILDYIYENEMPNDFNDAAKVFVAAEKLKLDTLKDYAGAILFSTVTKFNAIELLQLAINYNDAGLKTKCIDEIKKIFVGSALTIDEEIYENFELLKVIVEEKLQAEEKIRATMEKLKKSKM